MKTDSVTLEDIRAAHARIASRVHRTPVLTSAWLDEEVGARLYFKCENLQHVGAFKARGACNAVFSLSDEAAARGVVTHSSGNHGAALAWAARARGIAAHVVMPSNAAQPKQRAVAAYGARVVFCEPTLAAREATCARVQAETGATLVHPYNDLRVIAGQGTAAVELLEQAPGLEVVVVPVGGGGLLSGTAVAVKAVQAGTQVWGAEPAQADDASQSLRAGRIVQTTANTVADGLRSALGELDFPLIQAHVDDIVTVSEEEIVAAMRRLWEALRVIVEPSSAVAFAAVRGRRWSGGGPRVGLILTGGNVDLDHLPWSVGA
ncbi:pyridoxal-phosphate dependent enzyme [Horticoccus luteus]|uniref:Pyridoxal-phosphate dependent enzyme n=1 Tax=Horticoccus luteus TaxID=2862869 RepID=A0A8F9XKA2_9BACT|nr:pyridoxal-phosphate dependent enzyme [Horticoccus luteus]QYM77996.1 pyridoxal-phosphate dependent enzyme [Horticoccus luteus]